MQADISPAFAGELLRVQALDGFELEPCCRKSSPRVVSGWGDPRRAEAVGGKVTTLQAQCPFARSSAQPKRGTPPRRQDPRPSAPVKQDSAATPNEEAASAKPAASGGLDPPGG